MMWLRFLIFSLLITNHVCAQNPLENNFDHYTTASGLSNNTVNGIVQDKRGYMWIATAAGLNRFNGSRFVQFHSSDDSLSIPAEEIKSVAWIDDYRLAALSSGLHIVDTRNGRTRNIFVPYHRLQYQFKFNMMERVIGGDNGDLYVLTRSGFYHYDQDYKLIYRFDYYTEAEVATEHFFWGRELFELDDNRLLMTTINGIYLYDKRRRKVVKMTAGDCPILKELIVDPNIYNYFQPRRGSFIVHKIGTDSITYFNTIEKKKTYSLFPFKVPRYEFFWRSRLGTANDTLFYLTGHFSGYYEGHVNPASGVVTIIPGKRFESFMCNSLLLDKDKNLWIPTTKGLFRQNVQKSQVQTVILPSGMQLDYPDSKVDDIFVSDRKVYAGIRGGGGLFIFDKLTLKPEKQVLKKAKHVGVNHVRAITEFDTSTLLLGTNGPLMLFDREAYTLKDFIPPKWYYEGDWTNDIFKDSRNDIWISGNYIFRYLSASKTFKVFPNHPSLLSVPFAIEEDTAGNIWMAGHGLARYNTTVDSFDLVLDSFPYIKMPDKQINALAIDGYNRVWFNCHNNGLAAYDIAKKTFHHFTRRHGLPDNSLASMKVIGDKLWMAFNAGVACMDLRTFAIVSFGKDDGFPDMPVIRGARFFYDKDWKQLYIGFATAFVRFNPFDLLKKRVGPEIFIENLLLNGEENIFLPGKEITTNWDQNEISVTIGTINFSDGNNQSFAYRLVKENNGDWMQIGNQPAFNIANLSPGTHRLQVKAYSPNNRWPERIHEMSITVLPPVWKKNWFLFTVLGLILLLFYLVVKWRIGVVRKKEMEKTNIQRLKADHYKNQFELEQISNYFSSSLAEKTNEDEVLWDVAQNLIGRMNYEDCMIYLWNEDKTKMVQKAAYGPKGKPEYIESQVFDVLPGQGVVGHVISTRQPVLISDTRKDKRYRVDEKFRLSEVCVPIMYNDELLGIIDSEHQQLNYFTERDIKILSTIATLIANKIKQIQSEQSLDAKRLELENINLQLAEARLSALQSQMNPHFVFNALNSIKWMILDGDNEKASRYLSKFASMIRMTLDHSKEVFVTLDENIRYIRTYLEMEQLRFDDSFTYKISVGKNIDVAEITIPSMMIQPLVENAIWHGLMQAKHEKKILINFSQDENTITCTVEDNGIGIRHSQKMKEKTRATHHSVGLENLQNRVKIMNEKYDMNCSLVISDLNETGKNGSGTRVVLQFDVVNV